MDNIYKNIFKNNKLLTKGKNKKSKQLERIENEIKDTIRKEINYKEITSSCNNILNFLYDNKYYKKYFLLKLFIICYLSILISSASSFMFVSIIRDPVAAYNFKCYDLHTNTFYNCTYKNYCSKTFLTMSSYPTSLLQKVYKGNY